MMNGKKIIGVCLSKIHEQDRFNMVKMLNKVALENNYRLILFHLTTDLFYADMKVDQGEVTVFQLLPYDILDMVVILSISLMDTDTLKNLAHDVLAHHVPVISVDIPIEEEGVINLGYDNTGAFEKMCRHVIEDHHATDCLMMAGMRNNRFSNERVAEFMRVMRENGAQVDESAVGYGDFWDKPTLDTLNRWFEEEKRPYPQAIICANDTMALTVSIYLQDRGVRVPEDCIVTGFDGIFQADYHIPRLTTCTQDYEGMSRKIIEITDHILAGEPYERTAMIGHHIRFSQSCGCEQVDLNGVNTGIAHILDLLKLARARQDLTSQTQSAIAGMTEISELSSILLEKFAFHTMTLAINEDSFREPDFGTHHVGSNAFTDMVNVIYDRTYWWLRDSARIDRRQLAPHLDALLEREDPIMVCCIHSMELVLGYCVFQPELSFESYEQVTSFMSTIGVSLGMFHSQMQVKAVNLQLKSANEELEKLYIHDHMTGLLNRRGFYRQFRQKTQEAHRPDLHVILISADLDRLKFINDNFGHAEGDNAICTVGRALLACAIQGEICSRFGGDEFVVAALTAEDTSHYFASFRQRLSRYLEDYNKTSGKPYEISSSIGCAQMPIEASLNLDDLIRRADDEMYADKTARRKRRID